MKRWTESHLFCFAQNRQQERVDLPQRSAHILERSRPPHCDELYCRTHHNRLVWRFTRNLCA